MVRISATILALAAIAMSAAVHVRSAGDISAPHELHARSASGMFLVKRQAGAGNAEADKKFQEFESTLNNDQKAKGAAADKAADEADKSLSDDQKKALEEAIQLESKGKQGGNPAAVAAGTVVGVWHWAVYRDPGLFADPDRFDPDRFYSPGAKYADDRPDALNPFIVGPRNCIGQGLAYAEIRLVWAFDLRLADAAAGWMDRQKNFTLWEKSPLPVYLSPAKRPSP